VPGVTALVTYRRVRVYLGVVDALSGDPAVIDVTSQTLAARAPLPPLLAGTTDWTLASDLPS